MTGGCASCARLGAVGARPDAFKTVRYSEKLLEASGISVSTLDLSEVFGAAQKLGDDSERVRVKLEEIHAYAKSQAELAYLRQQMEQTQKAQEKREGTWKNYFKWL